MNKFTLKFLNWVERVGNKLPHPFWLFVILCLIIVFISFLCAKFNVSATNPATGETIRVVNLFSAHGLQSFVNKMVSSYADFAPLGLVLVMLIGVGVAEGSGLLNVAMKQLVFSVPQKLIIPVLFIVGVCGNLASDASIVIIPPLGGLVFLAMKRNPIIGIIIGYVGATAGFTANLFIAGTDVLLAGISQEAYQLINHSGEVYPTVNYFFMIAATFMIALVGTFVCIKVTIPRLEKDKEENLKNEEIVNISKKEKRGLLYTLIAILIYMIIVSLTIIPKSGLLRDPQQGTIVPSPFLSGLVPILFFLFVLAGVVYGYSVGTIKKIDDIIKFMTESVKSIAGLLVLFLVIAQFTTFFKWSNLAFIISVKGANFLRGIGFVGPLFFIGIILLTAFINMFLGSGAAKWAILAPFLVPMFYYLGYSPAFAQLIYRLGDSPTNCVSPLYPYFPALLGFIGRYSKKTGVGTTISLLLPYAIALQIAFIILILIWWLLKLPLGLGGNIFL